MYLKVEQPIIKLSAPFLEKRLQSWREVSFTHTGQNLSDDISPQQIWLQFREAIL